MTTTMPKTKTGPLTGRKPTPEEIEAARAEAESAYVAAVARAATGGQGTAADEDRLHAAMRTLDRPADEFRADLRAVRRLLATREQAKARPVMPAAERKAAMAAARAAVLAAERALADAVAAEMELVRSAEGEESMSLLLEEAEGRVRHLPGLAAALATAG